MAQIIKLPKMSDTMEEGVIVSWLVKVGDQVKSGDIIAEVETDKATMELENFEKGTILHLAAKEGDAIPVDSVIAIVGNPGEDFSSLLSGENVVAAKPAEVEPTPEKAEPAAQAVVLPTVEPTPSEDQRLKASPLAKKIAEEKGISLSGIQGTGDGGRIVRKDIENMAASPAIAPSTFTGASEGYTDVNVSQMRKTIAKRLSESKFSAPHFYLTMEINMDKAVEAREAMNTYSAVKISMNDIVVKAAAVALTRHPKVNSSWLNDKIRTYQHIHVGVAMALEDGNTFTVSNLGMFGIDSFTAIINPPDACILAVGAVKETVIVENGQMRPGKVMKVTLSCDHRVVDGVVGSKFLNTLKELIEEPVKLLV